MDPQKRKTLTSELQALVEEIAADLRRQLLVSGPARLRAEALHREERVGDNFDVWTDLLSRRAAVLWVLKTVYVRVLEDRGFVRPIRLKNRESQDLFDHLAPSLGDTAYLRWVFKDLASEGGLPELFAPQPAEVALPSNAISKKLLDFWRRTDEVSGALRYTFDDEHFDGRLMGDLYQDLDPLVKKRYALLQTPAFVVDFILDASLTPAIEEFGAETVRVLDPACGSGHFLLAAFKRLVTAMREKDATRGAKEIVADALSRVVGIDLNDYACGLARARLVITALESIDDPRLEAAGSFHPHIYWADALDQVEQDEQLALRHVQVRQPSFLLTRQDVRAALRSCIGARFHVVVGNPPFITEKDPNRKAYHTQKLGPRRRYVSAIGRYSLGVPFTERMLQCAVEGGYVGEIVADSFAKRPFGKALVEQVIARHDLRKVVATTGVKIQDHDTPTLIILARKRPPSSADPVLVVSSLRASSATSPDSTEGQPVWRSILAGHDTPGYRDEHIEVEARERRVLESHPWRVGAREIGVLAQKLDARSSPLREVTHSIGFDVITRASDLLELPRKVYLRLGIEDQLLMPHPCGEDTRNWACTPQCWLAVPYDRTEWSLLQISDFRGFARFLWPHRTWLARRFVSGGTRLCDVGSAYWAIPQLPKDKHRIPLSIVFAFKATHNHFVVEREAMAFNRTAPIIKLKPQATESSHFVVAAQLASSTAALWLRDACQVPGNAASEPWEDRIEHDGEKVKLFPLAFEEQPWLETASRRLHDLATTRLKDSVVNLIERAAPLGPAALNTALRERRERDLTRLLEMVGLQEELDWLCYKLYGIEPDIEIRAPDKVPPLLPGLRPFEITLARDDAERREVLARGEEPDEAPTEWFARHGWEAHTTLDALSASERAIIEERILRTEASRDLALAEQPSHKRRWYRPDYDADERSALGEWLSERLEGFAKERSEPFTVRQAAAALEGDPAVHAVSELLAGRPDFDLDALVAERVRVDSVPNQKHHVFTPSGLIKRSTWERSWGQQRREDSGEKIRPEVPQSYTNGTDKKKKQTKDFLKPEYWKLRGPLDVPKEAFIALTEVPGAEGRSALFAWSGLTHRQRARMLVELDEQAERAGVAREDRIGLLHGIWFLADYVAWESEPAAREFRAAVTAVVGEAGVTEAMLTAWAAAHPPPERPRKTAAKKLRREKDAEETDSV